MKVRNLCLRIPRKRHGVSLLGSTANAQHCMHVGLGQLAESPTQTVETVEKALATLQNIERLACDQRDHVSFAKAWMLMGKGLYTPWIMTLGWSLQRQTCSWRQLLLMVTPRSWWNTMPAWCTRQARGQRTSGLHRSSSCAVG